ncbi:MAG: tetratricopeptide repeat protein, partial [Asgard group archaeon]|nr:tetratricopeptide repeat protein [Asgard group archaeon]
EIGSKRDLNWYYANLGWYYLSIFDLDKALEYKLKGNNLRKDDVYNHQAYQSIGYIYHLKNDFSQAIEYYKKALKLCEEKGDKRRYLPGLLYNLVTSSIEINELQQAQQYVDYLYKVSNEVKEKNIEIYHKTASALVLKEDTRIRKWIEAEILFEQLLKEDLWPYFRIVILLNLTELLLKELQLSGNKEVLQEIDENVTELYNVAEKAHFYNLHVSTLRLQSQIALVELQPQKALQFLSQALIFSKDKKMVKITEEITLEKQKLNEQIGKWEGLQEKKAPISETL